MVAVINRTLEKAADMSTWNGVPDLLKRIYQMRGINEPSEISNELSGLLSFKELKGIDAATCAVLEALRRGDRFLIVGDYDVDGATSTALAVRALKAFAADNVDFLLPDRFIDGYGLSEGVVEKAKQFSPDFIITVDNGINSVAGVAAARSAGIKVLITDHHLQGEKLPQDCFIVNPNQSCDKFSSKALAGVGVIFYVMAAVRAKLRAENYFTEKDIPEPNMAEWLDLVALGTVADLVPFDRNNRILVQQGLLRIRAGMSCAGIQSLLAIAKKSYARIVSSDLGFVVAPRLNAAGRLDDMSIGVKCLLSETPEEASYYAEVLDKLNRQRKEKQTVMQDAARDAVEKIKKASDLPLGLCLFESDWHQGIVGLVASRIKDSCHRPVLAFARADNGELKGSGRSIKGLHLRDIIAEVSVLNPELITKFGGHAMAIGLSLREDCFGLFKKTFLEVLQKRMSKDLLNDSILSDGELLSCDLTLATARLLRVSGPWGQCFPEPVFSGEFEVLEQRLVGEKHLSLRLRIIETGVCFRAIFFNIDLQQWPNLRCTKVRAVYQLDVNSYNDTESLQLIVKYLQVVS